MNHAHTAKMDGRMGTHADWQHACRNPGGYQILAREAQQERKEASNRRPLFLGARAALLTALFGVPNTELYMYIPYVYISSGCAALLTALFIHLYQSSLSLYLGVRDRAVLLTALCGVPLFGVRTVERSQPGARFSWVREQRS